jgi:hypothetical protein
MGSNAGSPNNAIPTWIAPAVGQQLVHNNTPGTMVNAPGSAAAILSIAINTGAPGTLTVYDSNTASGTILAVIDTTTARFMEVHWNCFVGLVIVQTGTADVTVAYLGEALPQPEIVTAPVVSGNVARGNPLTTTNGAWTGSPSSYAYAWYSAGNPVGTNSNTYTTGVADRGNMVHCDVTAANAGGPNTASSNSVGPIV